MTAEVNGETVCSQKKAGYMAIPGNWKTGDIIKLTIPMSLGKYLARDNPNKVAFTYGPCTGRRIAGRVIRNQILLLVK